MASTAIRTTAERFWDKVDKTDACWNWTAAKDKKGYGYFGVRKGNTVLAHRYSWELLRGAIPEGLHIDHLCRNTSCVNPLHLEPVTPRENILRGIRRQPDTHCAKGHPLKGENVILRPNGRQRCRTCNRAYDRERKARIRAQAREAAA